MKNKPTTTEKIELKRITLLLTNYCQFKCLHCLQKPTNSKNLQNLPLNLIIQIIEEASQFLKIDYVALSGGEPLLHPNFDAIVEFLAKSSISFAIVTNGWNFEKHFKTLLKYKKWVKNITFSLDGSSEATHNTIRNNKKSFRKIISGITLCKFHNLPCQINMVVTKQNYLELENMALLASHLQCNALAFGHCLPTADNIINNLILTPIEKKEIEHKVAVLQKIFKLPIYIAGDHFEPNSTGKCSQLAGKEFTVNSKGELTVCCMLSNYRTDNENKDFEIISDLNSMELIAALKLLQEKLIDINEKKQKWQQNNAKQPAANFSCSFCLHHFKKHDYF